MERKGKEEGGRDGGKDPITVIYVTGFFRGVAVAGSCGVGNLRRLTCDGFIRQGTREMGSVLAMYWNLEARPVP